VAALAPTSSIASPKPPKPLIFGFWVGLLKSPYKSGATYLFRYIALNPLNVLDLGLDFSLVISKEENSGGEDGQVHGGPKRPALSPIAQFLDGRNGTTSDIETAGGSNGRF
jgi:hypothetical protein